MNEKPKGDRQVRTGQPVGTPGGRQILFFTADSQRVAPIRLLCVLPEAAEPRGACCELLLAKCLGVLLH